MRLGLGAVTMQPRFSIQILAVVSLCLTVMAAPMAATDCADWNSSKYFRAAGVEHVAACLASGADPKTGDKHGNTPLHWAAAFNKNPAVITALLNAGADPKARNEDGMTPWDCAKDNEALKGSDAYWRLNDARF